MSASIELGDPYRFPQTPSFTRGDPYLPPNHLIGGPVPLPPNPLIYARRSLPPPPNHLIGGPYGFPRTPHLVWGPVPLPPNPSLTREQPREKFANGRRRLARSFCLHVVARAGDDDDARADDPLTEKPRELRGRELVLVAADDERRRGDRRDAAHHVEDIACLEIAEHHPGRVVCRRPMQRRSQFGRCFRADGEAHQEIDALVAVFREQVEQPRQHSKAGAGGDEDEAVETLRIGQGELLSDRPTHGVSADDDARDSQRVEERRDHRRRVLDRLRNAAARASVSWQIQRHDVADVGEAFELARPDLARTSRAVHEAQRRRTGARRDVGDLETIDGDRRHEELRYIMPGRRSAMRQGIRVIDSDTHVNPSLDVLLRYADRPLRDRLDELAPYTRKGKGPARPWRRRRS